MNDQKRRETRKAVEALRATLGAMVTDMVIRPEVFELIDVAICGHMDTLTQSRFIDDINSRGTVERLANA